MGRASEALQRALGHNSIADRGLRRRFRGTIIFHFATFRLLLRPAVAQPDLMLVRTNLHDFEFVLAPGIEQSALARALPGPTGLRLIAFAATVFDLGNMAQALDAVRQIPRTLRKVVTRDTFPRTKSPVLCFSNQVDQMSFTCLTPSDTRRVAASIFSTLASTSSPFFRTSAGVLILPVQEISLT